MSFFKISKKLLAANVVLEPIRFSTSPDRYRHWKIEVNGEMAKFVWKTDVTAPLRPGYEMKDQTYDLGVDIELADAIDRIRFENPQGKVLWMGSGWKIGR